MALAPNAEDALAQLQTTLAGQDPRSAVTYFSPGGRALALDLRCRRVPKSFRLADSFMNVAPFSTPTSTRSTRRVEQRDRPELRGQAGRGRRRVGARGRHGGELRGARLRHPLRDAGLRGAAALPARDLHPRRHGEVPAREPARLRDLPALLAAGRRSLAGRGVPRPDRHDRLLGDAVSVAERLRAEVRATTGLAALGRDRAGEDGRQDRDRSREARRAARRRARRGARRSSRRCRSAASGASARSGGRGSTRSASPPSATSRRRPTTRLRARARRLRRRVSRVSRAARTNARSSRIARPSRTARRTPSRATSPSRAALAAPIRAHAEAVARRLRHDRVRRPRRHAEAQARAPARRRAAIP